MQKDYSENLTLCYNDDKRQIINGNKLINTPLYYLNDIYCWNELNKQCLFCWTNQTIHLYRMSKKKKEKNTN